MHINLWFVEALYYYYYYFNIKYFNFSNETVLNIKLHLPFVLVSLFDSSFTFTPNSICPLGDFSPSPTQQMVKVEHLTGLCCTCLEDEDPCSYI